MTAPFLCFDIETRPLPHLVDLFFKPGRLKDPAKIQAALEDARADAALDPKTGSIVVIGYIDQDGNIAHDYGQEETILERFWHRFTVQGGADTKFLFWSGCGAAGKMFDIDYIVTRSRILGVKVPPQVRSGRFYSGRIVDLASEFLLYQNDAYLSLSNMGHVFGFYDDPANGVTPKKDTDEVRGDNFWQVFEQDKTKALTYLDNDLRLTRLGALRILQG